MSNVSDCMYDCVCSSQTYNLAEVATLAGVSGGFVIGAGAGSCKVTGVNCEVRLAFHVIYGHIYYTVPHSPIRIPHWWEI